MNFGEPVLGLYDDFLLFLAVFLFRNSIIYYFLQLISGDAERIADAFKRPFYHCFITSATNQ